MSATRWTAAGILLLLVLLALAYSPGVRDDFLDWDDQPYIRDNPLLRSPEGLARIWTTREAPQYYPLTFSSYWLEYQIWGPRPRAYFLGNLLLHALNVLLLGLLLRALRLRPRVIWFACALFALHPIQVAAVAWMAERKTLLAGFFFLLTILFFLRHRESGSRRDYALMLAAYLLAILSKTVAVTVIGSILLLEWWVFRRRDRALYLKLLPLLLLAIPLLFVVGGRERALQAPPSDLSWALRPLFAASAFWAYLGKIAAPLRLQAVYPSWEISAGRVLWWLPLLALLAAGFAFLRWRSRFTPAAAWGIGHGALSLLPALGLFHFGYLDHSPIGDHLAYFAMMGVMPAVAIGADRLAGGLVEARGSRSAGPGSRGGKDARRLAVSAAALCLLAALSFKTWRQVHVWRDAEVFWAYNLEHNPGAAVAHLNIGAGLADRGEYAEALPYLEYAAKRHPGDSLAQTNLAGVLLNLGRSEESLEHARTAVRLNPSSALARIFLGAALARTGNPEEALTEYDEALRLEPRNSQAMGWKGEALQALGRFEEAEGVLHGMLRVDPAEPRGHLLLGNLRVAQGDPQAGLVEYDAALALDPRNIAALRNKASLLVRLGRRGDAAQALAAVLLLVPQDGPAHGDLASLLDRQGRRDEALSHYRRAAALMPEDPAAQMALAGALGARGDEAGAVEAFRSTLKLDPQSVPALAQLAWILATTPVRESRDPGEAVRLAEGACQATGGANPAVLDILAAAYASAGRFPEAVGTAEQAITLAKAAGSSVRPEPIERRLELYKKGRPFARTSTPEGAGTP